ncbi:MAG TPA: glycosyltransferase family 2 protein [Planctomycetota bacterium]|nr:glycosyltransferase family 2 protein [Planctomycetota bacterium]
MTDARFDLRGLKLSVVIPVYNERTTIEEILRRVEAAGLAHEILVVDDASTDGTREILQRLSASTAEGGGATKLRLLCHETNRGKGRALRTGFDAASGDIVLVQDADLEYDPADYPALLKPIVDGVADVVIGSRFLSGPHRVLYFWHYLGNRFLTTLSNVLTNLNLTDMECCYKVFRADVLRRLVLRSERFGIEPELVARVAQLGCRIYEVPVSYFGRDYAHGKKITWTDGLAAIWHILRFSLTRPRRREPNAK